MQACDIYHYIFMERENWKRNEIEMKKNQEEILEISLPLDIYRENLNKKTRNKIELTDNVANMESLSSSPFFVVDVSYGGPSSRVSNLVYSGIRNLQHHGHQRHNHSEDSAHWSHGSINWEYQPKDWLNLICFGWGMAEAENGLPLREYIKLLEEWPGWEVGGSWKLKTQKENWLILGTLLDLCWLSLIEKSWHISICDLGVHLNSVWLPLIS